MLAFNARILIVEVHFHPCSMPMGRSEMAGRIVLSTSSFIFVPSDQYQNTLRIQFNQIKAIKRSEMRFNSRRMQVFFFNVSSFAEQSAFSPFSLWIQSSVSDEKKSVQRKRRKKKRLRSSHAVDGNHLHTKSQEEKVDTHAEDEKKFDSLDQKEDDDDCDDNDDDGVAMEENEEVAEQSRKAEKKVILHEFRFRVVETFQEQLLGFLKELLKASKNVISMSELLENFGIAFRPQLSLREDLLMQAQVYRQTFQGFLIGKVFVHDHSPFMLTFVSFTRAVVDRMALQDLSNIVLCDDCRTLVLFVVDHAQLSSSGSLCNSICFNFFHRDHAISVYHALYSLLLRPHGSRLREKRKVQSESSASKLLQRMHQRKDKEAEKSESEGSDDRQYGGMPFGERGFRVNNDHILFFKSPSLSSSGRTSGEEKSESGPKSMFQTKKMTTSGIALAFSQGAKHKRGGDLEGENSSPSTCIPRIYRGQEWSLDHLQNEWIQCRLSTFEYIMRLNHLCGRTTDRRDRYPVFPWIFSERLYCYPSQGERDVESKEMVEDFENHELIYTRSLLSSLRISKFKSNLRKKRTRGLSATKCGKIQGIQDLDFENDASLYTDFSSVKHRRKLIDEEGTMVYFHRRYPILMQQECSSKGSLDGPDVEIDARATVEVERMKKERKMRRDHPFLWDQSRHSKWSRSVKELYNHSPWELPPEFFMGASNFHICDERTCEMFANGEIGIDRDDHAGIDDGTCGFDDATDAGEFQFLPPHRSQSELDRDVENIDDGKMDMRDESDDEEGETLESEREKMLSEQCTSVLSFPSWCDSFEEFVYAHRVGLESTLIGVQLHIWIDRTFGVEQEDIQMRLFGSQHPRRVIESEELTKTEQSKEEEVEKEEEEEEEEEEDFISEKSKPSIKTIDWEEQRIAFFKGIEPHFADFITKIDASVSSVISKVVAMSYCLPGVFKSVERLKSSINAIQKELRDHFHTSTSQTSGEAVSNSPSREQQHQTDERSIFLSRLESEYRTLREGSHVRPLMDDWSFIQAMRSGMSEEEQSLYDSRNSSIQKCINEMKMWKKKPPSTIRGIKLRDLERKLKTYQDALVEIVFGDESAKYEALLENRISRLKERLKSKVANQTSARVSVEIQCELDEEGRREQEMVPFVDVGVQCVVEEENMTPLHPTESPESVSLDVRKNTSHFESSVALMDEDLRTLKRELIHASMLSHGIHRAVSDDKNTSDKCDDTHRDSERSGMDDELDDMNDIQGIWGATLHRIRGMEKKKRLSFRKLMSEKRAVMRKAEDQQRSSLEIDLLPAVGRSKGRKRESKKYT
eukprot:TRINITY_DN1482_c0_g1_i13.p1 TRINITY_DN1482_c0_g1~~TRINITY_DN1482_c0_g1_i13.p1  ORF type:complete len:1315 (-),score=409.98 TRINITY_DN1482_c0_g1_i13:290-4234(-)